MKCKSLICKKYKDLIHSGKFTVIAGFYDFRGEFGKGQGTIVIVNVNKHKGINEIHNMPAFEDLIPEQKELHIGRLGQ